MLASLPRVILNRFVPLTAAGDYPNEHCWWLKRWNSRSGHHRSAAETSSVALRTMPYDHWNIFNDRQLCRNPWNI